MREGKEMLTEANVSHFLPSDGNAGLCLPHTQKISQTQYVKDNILRH